MRFKLYKLQFGAKRPQLFAILGTQCVFKRVDPITLIKVLLFSNFESKFEHKCILKFKPFANDENFKKYIQEKPSQINLIDIHSYLNNLNI